MTNCCLSLISFVVKRPLIHDCLAEAALLETQLKQDRQASLAEKHVSSGSYLPVEELVMTSPLEISPPPARPRASHPVHEKGSRVSVSGEQGEDREEDTIGARVCFCGLFIPSIFKYVLMNYCKCC